ncbi:odorant receptor 13a-like [Aphidius gifuensis]|uniref:odorant receptor 13a-like n=1 Tax=Aphidius gifuensis TaxID=684658 RepID=UPI001CDB7437|nr:odorant receptor 13a-like [Aphidius gifuensis]
MMLCGTWPEQSFTTKLTIRILHTGPIIILLIAEFFYFYGIRGDFREVIPCLPSPMTIFVAFIKFNLLASNKKMVKDIIDKMRNDWEYLEKTSTNKIMHINAAKGRQRILTYMYYLMISASMYIGCSFIPKALDIIIPLNETRKNIAPFETDYKVDLDDYFYLIVLHGLVTCTTTVTFLWVTDAFIMVMVQHCCGLFGTIGHVLKQLNEKISEKDEKNIINYAILMHKRAITFADFIESTVTVMYGFVVLINMIAISVTGVETIFRWDNQDVRLKFVAYTIAEIVHLFFNTLPSQQLIDDSGKVFDSIYECDWSSLSIKSQKLIWLMLVRSTRPCYLTAGKFYELNMENFSQVVRTAVSYLTVLTSFK